MNLSKDLTTPPTEPSETFFLLIFTLIGILILIGALVAIVFILCILTNSSLQSVSTLLSCNSCAIGLFYYLFHTFYIILAFYPLPTYRENSVLCQLIGYMYSVTCCGISWSHAVLASNRLCFSLFSKQRWLRTYTFAWYLIAVHWFLTFALPFPFIFSQAYQYQVESRICILTTRHTSTALLGVIFFYNVPFTSILIIYILVWLHARRPTLVTLARNKRDLAIMRHILTLVIIDIACGHPYMTLILLDYLGKAAAEWYLLVTVFITLSVTANMCAIFIFNRKLRKFLLLKWTGWRVPHSNSSTTTSVMIPMRISTFSFNSSNIKSDFVKTPTRHEFKKIEE